MNRVFIDKHGQFYSAEHARLVEDTEKLFPSDKLVAALDHLAQPVAASSIDEMMQTYETYLVHKAAEVEPLPSSIVAIDPTALTPEEVERKAKLDKLMGRS